MSNPSTRDDSPDTDQRSGDRSGEVLGQVRDYVLLEQLGQGGMGTVYKARHTMLENEVAIKLLPRERMNDEESVSRFRREMKAVGKLKHPNIVQALDAGEEGGIHYLVMEYADGMDLSKIRKQIGKLSLADACEVVRQAAVGLQHAHEFGMVHRDIKPSNLLLTHDGQVKVLDLGLALLQSDPNFGRELTSTGQIMGTMDYIAPEQVDDTHAVDIRADIYSLGCTLYCLLSGEPPFGGPQYSSPLKKMRAHDQTPPPPIQQKHKEVPDVIATMLDRMLAKAPEDRYQTPAEIVDALQPFCDGADLRGLLGEAQALDLQTRTIENSSASGTEQNASSALTSTRPLDKTLETPDDQEDSRTGRAIEPTIDLGQQTARRGSSDSIARRGSPDPVETADRRSPEVPAQLDESGDLRSKSVRGQRPAHSSQRPAHSSRRSRWQISIVMLIPLLIAAVFFGPQIIRIATGKGQLIIEANAEQIEVIVRKDGAEIVDRQTKRRYDLKMGDYEIEVRELPEGIKLLTKKFTITRGGRDVLNVEAELAKTQPFEKQPSTIDLSEPLPLAQWLKGRKIITVKQDGTADFTSIQKALRSVKDGQVVEVLDRGPYRERIGLPEPAPKDIGLFTRVDTIVESDDWYYEGSGIGVGHSILGANGFRLSGFVLPFQNELPVRQLFVGSAVNVTIENCAIYAIGAPKENEHVAIYYAVDDQGLPKDGTVHLRDCSIFNSSLILRISLKKRQVNVVVQNCFIDNSMGPAALFMGSNVNLTVKNNVFKSPSDRVSFGIRNPKMRLTIVNNTMLTDVLRIEQAAAYELLTNATIANNIMPYLEMYGTPATTKSRMPLARKHWQIHHNNYTNHEDRPNWFKPGPTEKSHQPDFLSSDPLSANYLRLPRDCPLATGGAGGVLPSYIGALPPGPALAEGDWFTRLQERWKDVVDQKDEPSAISIPKIEEPPSLEEWLKGRTVLTVAQDGSGQFRTISDALRALK